MALRCRFMILCSSGRQISDFHKWLLCYFGENLRSNHSTLFSYEPDILKALCVRGRLQTMLWRLLFYGRQPQQVKDILFMSKATVLGLTLLRCFFIVDSNNHDWQSFNTCSRLTATGLNLKLCWRLFTVDSSRSQPERTSTEWKFCAADP